MRWTRRTIITEIRRLYRTRAALNYASAEANHLSLVRAAAWHFGSWRRAVEAAGIDYEALSKYRRWNRQRIVERIRELHAEGADLSWRSVSLELDPPLAAAALRPNGFASWRAAVTAAGLDSNSTARYQAWNPDRVVREIQRLHRAGHPLSSKSVQDTNQPLFCAARRRFGSWDDALAKAGLNAAKIRLRRSTRTNRSEIATTRRRSGTATRVTRASQRATHSTAQRERSGRTAGTGRQTTHATPKQPARRVARAR